MISEQKADPVAAEATVAARRGALGEASAGADGRQVSPSRDRNAPRSDPPGGCRAAGAVSPRTSSRRSTGPSRRAVRSRCGGRGRGLPARTQRSGGSRSVRALGARVTAALQLCACGAPRQGPTLPRTCTALDSSRRPPCCLCARSRRATARSRRGGTERAPRAGTPARPAPTREGRTERARQR
jgi:hypothetical protein